MDEKLRSSINAFGKSKAALMKAQRTANIARLELLEVCIENRNHEFLTLDETAIKRYCGVSDWLSFPDS